MFNANEQTQHWIYRDGYPIARSGSFDEADAKARKAFEAYPDSHVTVKRRKLIEEEVRSYKPFPSKRRDL